MATSRTKARIAPFLFDGVIWLSQLRRKLCLSGSVRKFSRLDRPLSAADKRNHQYWPVASLSSLVANGSDPI
jgi:hypothetical protein